jgi:hypothetical protein
MSFPAQEQQTIGSGLNNPLGLITAQHRSFLAHIAQTGFDDAKDAYHDLISRSPANHPGKDGIEYVGMTLVFEEEEKISGGAAPGAFDASRWYLAKHRRRLKRRLAGYVFLVFL